jgi:hypothetical protein
MFLVIAIERSFCKSLRVDSENGSPTVPLGDGEQFCQVIEMETNSVVCK